MVFGFVFGFATILKVTQHKSKDPQKPVKLWPYPAFLFGASGPAQSKLAQRGPKSAKIAMKMSSDGKGAQCGPTRDREID